MVIKQLELETKEKHKKHILRKRNLNKISGSSQPNHLFLHFFKVSTMLHSYLRIIIKGSPKW